MYLEPVDTRTMKRIGINIAALIAVAFALIAVVATVV